MSTETQEPVEMGTKPVKEHQWLQKLVGEWRVEMEMSMGPDQPKMRSEFKESVKSVGGLWAFGERTGVMPDGSPTLTYATLGYDVSFKEYRGCSFASMCPHLWKQAGTLSPDGKVMTLHYTGPSMIVDAETANYRDILEIVDEDHRTNTSYGQDETGDWREFMKESYTRILRRCGLSNPTIPFHTSDRHRPQRQSLRPLTPH